MSLGTRHKAGATALPVEGHLPGFAGATGWLNTPPLTDADLSEKVVLVDFWTYTCINWLRTLSYVRAWAEKYDDQGLVVVGVHTPEFPFEREAENVRWAAREMNVDYPIALDSDYAVWSAFANRYWPAVYIADAEGKSAITSSARVDTRSANGSSRCCCARPDRTRWRMAWSTSRPTAWRHGPTGRPSGLRRRISTTNRRRRASRIG